MNSTLPVVAYRDEIIAAAENHHVVIIKAETGSGKSTQVPQFLLRSFHHVVVTQPRRIAATSLAQRIAQEMQCTVGGVVGYHTSLERDVSADTRLLLCTDGIELVHKLIGKETAEEVLVIDEVHEWNVNIELLVAWARHELIAGTLKKLVLMSATIDQDRLSQYFKDAVVIEIPGREFPVTERSRGKSALHDTITLLSEGHNVLVFQPGKSDILRMVSSIKKRGIDAEVFPLYGELPAVDQLPCFLSYQRPKCVIATNIAQTSVTIPDIDAVVDSGLERRAEYVEGVDGLYIRPISLADREQRKGRAGRTKRGIYIDECPVDLNSRAIFSEPDMVRLSLERVVLRLASAGVDISDMQFYHQPKRERIKEARRVLEILECVDEYGHLTEIGEKVARLPTSVRFGRMLIEAEKRDVLPDVITLVSIMTHGSITNTEEQKWKSRLPVVSPWSDAFMQLAAYDIAAGLEEEALEEQGINPHAFAEARMMRHRLYTATSHWDTEGRSTGRPRDVVATIYAGTLDLLYKRSLVGGYKDQKGNIRDLPTDSVVADAEWVVGLPWNLQMTTSFGPKTMHMITMATRFDPSLATEVFPNRIKKIEEASTQEGDFRVQVVSTYFDGVLLGKERRRA